MIKIILFGCLLSAYLLVNHVEEEIKEKAKD